LMELTYVRSKVLESCHDSDTFIKFFTLIQNIHRMSAKHIPILLD
jgi:hypothetical protein